MITNFRFVVASGGTFVVSRLLIHLSQSDWWCGQCWCLVMSFLLLAGVSIIATRTEWRNYMFAVVCIHVVCMRGLNSVLDDEKIFYAIVAMVYAVL